MAERFLASHSRLMRSAAEGLSSSEELDWSSFGRIIGIALSCSFSWALKSLGGRRPRSRKAASRHSLVNAFGPAGVRGTVGDEVCIRGVNFVVSLRMMVRGLAHEWCSVACLMVGGKMRN